MLSISCLMLLRWNNLGYRLNVPFDKQISHYVDYNSFQKSTLDLMKDIKASSSLLWDVNVNNNMRTAVYFYIEGKGRLTRHEGFAAPVFTNVVNSNKAMAQMFAGNGGCTNTINSNPIGVELSNSSIINLCRIPIISQTGIMIGYVSFGFTENPSPEKEQEILSKMKALAKEISLKATKK